MKEVLEEGVPSLKGRIGCAVEYKSSKAKGGAGGSTEPTEKLPFLERCLDHGDTSPNVLERIIFGFAPDANPDGAAAAEKSKAGLPRTDVLILMDRFSAGINLQDASTVVRVPPAARIH